MAYSPGSEHENARSGAGKGPNACSCLDQAMGVSTALGAGLVAGGQPTKAKRAQTTKPELFNEVISFLSYELNVAEKKVNPTNCLFHDFRVAGDDGIELIERFSKKFDVNVNEFAPFIYFGPEDSSSIFKMVKEIFTREEFRNTPRLEVEHLVKAAQIGELKSIPNFMYALFELCHIYSLQSRLRPR